MTDKEIRKEIYDLRRELRADISEVNRLRNTSDSAIPTYATDRMKVLEREMREKSVKNMSRNELENVYRDLKYVRGLKSSTVEGAIKTGRTIEPLKEKLKTLSPDLQKNFWAIYSKLYGDTATEIDRFKYVIFESDLVDSIYQGMDVDDFTNTIEKLFREYLEIYETDGGIRREAEKLAEMNDTEFDEHSVSYFENVLENERSIYFAKRLRDILR